jgi:chloramphenicol 3-O phosphotransferase
VILNGAPRSGKTSIARAIQAASPQPWLNIGVDLVMKATPERYLPGIGLRPGGERPDLEPFVAASYAALYDAVAAHARHGLNVVVDVGHHDAYSRPLGTLPDAARRLDGLPALIVGVRCPLDVIAARREATGWAAADEGPATPPAMRWQEAVHDPGIYDLEVDTSVVTPEEAAAAVLARVRDASPSTALARLRGPG